MNQLRELEEVLDILGSVELYSGPRPLDKAFQIIRKLVDQLRAEDARREQDTIRRSAQEADAAIEASGWGEDGDDVVASLRKPMAKILRAAYAVQFGARGEMGAPEQ